MYQYLEGIADKTSFSENQRDVSARNKKATFIPMTRIPSYRTSKLMEY
jgi:hypothetical protein